MFFKRFVAHGLAHYSYLIELGKGLAAVVDPTRDVTRYLRAAARAGLTIRYVLETHRHEDVVHGSSALRQMIGATVITGTHAFFSPGDIRLEDGEAIKLGTAKIRALATPGHTPESFSYAVSFTETSGHAWGIFTGDALLAGATGRTDLGESHEPTENAELLYDALHEKILPLGDHTLVFPSHGPASRCALGIASRAMTTVGLEMRVNPVFQLSRADFAALKARERLPRPPYFSVMEDVNLMGGLPMKWPQTFTIMPPEDFAANMVQGLVLDTRPPEAFAGGHIPGSVSVPMPLMPHYAGWLAKPQTKLFLVLQHERELAPTLLGLARIGLDEVTGVLSGGFESWRDSGFPIDRIGTTTPTEAYANTLLHKIQILDIRDESEWEREGYIPNSHRFYVGNLVTRPPDLKSDKPIILCCDTGLRSSLAASLLLRHGFLNVSNMLGGFASWKKLKLPVKHPLSSPVFKPALETA